MAEKCEFKSADELGLAPEEWAALIKTLMALEAGTLVHVEDYWSAEPLKAKGKRPFNMEVWDEKYKCGSVCCIGGSAEFLGGLKHEQLVERSQELSDNGNRELSELFYPGHRSSFSADYDKLTVRQAARALRGYLTTGNTSWYKALQEK